MNLLFDLKSTQPVKTTKVHGGGRYGEVILKRIIERGLPVCCCYDSHLWINPEMIKLIEDNNIPLFDLALNKLEKIIDDEKISLLYLPAFVNVSNFLAIDNCPILGTIHDLRSLETPLDIYRIGYKPICNVPKFFLKKVLTGIDKSRQKAKIEKVFKKENFKFVTVSNHSAFAFKSYFPQYGTMEIPVFYSPSTSLVETTSKKYIENYFLLVSANRYNKNNLRAIIALDKLFSNGYANDFRVKVTGVKGPEAFWYCIKNRDRFDFVGFVDEYELDQLYHDAYCFIYPSLNEGFGYPPLEAMRYGVPVLASPLSSIPEVCGGNVTYFNPFSIEEIMNRVLQILDKGTHDKYSQLAKERYEIITKKQREDLDRLIDYIYKIER